MPTFNSEKFLSEAIQSVQNQSYQNWELLVVDDASSDTTLSILTSTAAKDHRVKWQQLSRNCGTGKARNAALAMATGAFIAFLDADDMWKKNKLQVQLDFMHAHQLPFTFSFYECIDEAGNSLNRRVEAPRNLSYLQLFFCNYVGNLTGIYNVNFFGKIAISPIRKRQDWMHWLTVLKKIKTARPVPESLAYYRVRKDSLSTSKLDLIKYNFTVYRKFHGYSFPIAVACMKLFLFTQLLIKPWYVKRIKASS
jgi:glycosyltransferase involved in cell wall biosynthesis